MKNSGRARYACALEAEVGGRCTFEKGVPVVETRTFKIEVQQIIRFFIRSNP